MQESGVVVLDKWRHFVPLLFATRLNGPDRDGDANMGKRGVYGNKETFWLSWELSGYLEYAFHDSATETMDILDKWRGSRESPRPAEYHGDDNEGYEDANASKNKVCSAQLLHFDREGKPLRFNGWIEKQKFEGDFEATSFDVYVKKHKAAGRRKRSSSWDIKSDNIVCLKADEHFAFDDGERGVLEMIQELAKNC